MSSETKQREIQRGERNNPREDITIQQTFESVNNESEKSVITFNKQRQVANVIQQKCKEKAKQFREEGKGEKRLKAEEREIRRRKQNNPKED